jgi:hypothetical protein
MAGGCESSNEPVFHQMRGIFRLAEDLLASQEGPCSIKSFSYVCIYTYICTNLIELCRNCSIYIGIFYPEETCRMFP